MAVERRVLLRAASGMLAGCATASGASIASGASDVRGLLDRRAAAVLDRDEAAFLGTVDPADGTYRDAQRQVFANLAALPLASWSYRLLRVRAAVAEVGLSYRLRGCDAAPVTSTARLGLAGRDGGRYVASGGEGGLWDRGTLRVARGAHSLVLGVDGASPDEYTGAADRAVEAVRNVWGGAGWADRVAVVVPASLDGMAALLDAAPATYRGLAAVTVAPADRVTVNPEAFAQLSPQGRQVVLTHETTHVATRAATGPDTPVWLSEGFADWIGYRGTTLTVRQIAAELDRAARLPERLPADADFGTTEGSLPEAYEAAWLACRLIAGEWGTDGLTGLYRAIGAGATVDAAMRDRLGVGLDAFTASWRAYLERELR